MTNLFRPAPAWEIERWFNADESFDLASLHGKVVVAGAFQMLCPGCVTYRIPQLLQAHKLFPADDVAVVGLHTVFEHHAAMTPTSLEAFLHEYRIPFPVGVDRPGGAHDPLPRTMRAYGMQGTPTLLLIDRRGRLRRQAFGHIPDLQLGAEIAALMTEQSIALAKQTEPTGQDCTRGVCAAG